MNKKLINKINKENISYSELARKVNITYFAIRNYCKGRLPKLDIALRIAKELNSTVEELFKIDK